MGRRNMSETTTEGSVFVQDLNPMSGKSSWSVMAADYDYQQEVARAGFADMLHDSERVSRIFSFYFCSYYGYRPVVRAGNKH